MSRTCAGCTAVLSAPGPAGGRPRRRCARCRRAAAAEAARCRRRRTRARRPDRVADAEWRSLHLTADVAARIARDGLVVADATAPDPDEEDS